MWLNLPNQATINLNNSCVFRKSRNKNNFMVVFNFDSVTTIPCEREGRVIRANCYVYNAKDEDEADSLIDYLNSQLGAKEWPEKQ